MAERKNQFADLLNKQPGPAARPSSGVGRGKHIGGYFDPAVARQIKALAVEEDTTVQQLVAEALDLLFQSRNRPPIARQG